MSLQFLPLQLNLYNIVKDELLFYTSIAQDRGINIINSISQGITIHAIQICSRRLSATL